MKVIKSEKLSKQFDERFICIDESTGEILDDAQGWGYKSMQKAYAAYNYKHPTQEKMDRDNRIMDKIEEYIKNNPEEYERMNEEILGIQFYGWKDGEDECDILHAVWHRVKQISFPFDEVGIKAKDFLKYADRLSERRKQQTKKKNKKKKEKQKKENEK